MAAQTGVAMLEHPGSGRRDSQSCYSPGCLLKAGRCGSSGMVGFELFTRFGWYQESIVGGDYGIA